MLKIRTKRKIKIFSAIFLVIAFILFPFRFDNLAVEKTRAEWPEAGSLIIDHDETWSGIQTFDRDIVIQSGSTLKIEKGAKIEFNRKENGEAPSLYVADGNIEAAGTPDEKITFTSAGMPEGGFSIIFQSAGNKESLLRYVEISHGGSQSEVYQTGFKNNDLLSNAYAETVNSSAVIYHLGPVRIENSRFVDNFYSDIEAQAYLSGQDEELSHLVVGNSNFEGNNEDYAMISEIYCETLRGEECTKKVSLLNGWFGSESGPSEDWFPQPFGKKVKGTFQLGDYRKKDTIEDPAVVIPGIMGSYEAGGEWWLDPILFTYSDLLKSFEVNGYEKDRNLFEFPYDWRRKNEDTANDLKAKIEEIRNLAGVSKVDLVAHSMGGLVARALVESANYDNSIDQLITLATPHKGAPKAYLQWEAGEGFFSFFDAIAKHHFTQEAEEHGYADIYSYIRLAIPSVQELLPDYNYLVQAGTNAERIYPTDNYPQNSFLETLNDPLNLEKLHKVKFTNIVGNLPIENSTISKIRTVGSTISGRWEHGMPENFENEETDRGLERGYGDETVPISSSEGITADDLPIVIESSHGDLPTKAQKKVISLLTGKDESKLRYVDDMNIPDIFLINVFSPVDIQVISPSGLCAGKNFDTWETYNEIPMAFYSGFDKPCEDDPSNFCEMKSEFIAIPNPEEGEYTILTQGTGDGSYRIEATRITKGKTASQKVNEATIILEGQAHLDELGDEQNIILPEQSSDTTLPAITITSPEDQKNYLNDRYALPVEYSVDDESSVSKNVQLDDRPFAENEIDLSLQKLGEHTLKISAADEAGNRSEQSSTFRISTDIGALRKNFKHYFDLKLVKNKLAKEYFDLRLKNLEKLFNLLEQAQNSKSKPLPKKIAVEALKKVIKADINLLVSQIKRKSPSWINPKAADLLIEGLNFIRP